MTRDEVIRALCEMCEEINARHFKWSIPSDCFCGHGPPHVNDPRWQYQFHPKMIEFIRRAVEEKLETLKHGS